MMYKSLSLFVIAFALMSLVILTSCAPQTPIPVTSEASFCQIAKIITFSRLHDTEQTIAQVKEHNAVFAKLCGSYSATAFTP